MVKKIIDMRRENLKKELQNKEVLDVYFLIENEPTTHYHLVTIVVKTDKVIYISPRGYYSFESSGGGKAALIDVIKSILSIKNNFSSFHFWCAENQDLKILEDETYLECNALPKAECKDSNIINETYNKFLKLKKFILNNLKLDKAN